MGLTIHWTLKSQVRSPDAARGLIDQLREHALTLPFQRVGEPIDLEGDAANFERVSRDAPHRWLLCQAGAYFPHGERHFSVPPSHVIAFETFPGDGCEPANFGLCRYPAQVDLDEEQGVGTRIRRSPKRIPTGLTGWRWSSFCKTQYASNPECGGVENFLRCHLSVIALLDRAKSLGLVHEVSDEGDYWTSRDVPALARTVGEWNEGIAAFAGQLKDQFGDNVQSAIAAFPDFECLEARGVERNRKRNQPPE